MIATPTSQTWSTGTTATSGVKNDINSHVTDMVNAVAPGEHTTAKPGETTTPEETLCQ